MGFSLKNIKYLLGLIVLMIALPRAWSQSDLTAIRYNHSNYADLNPAYVGVLGDQRSATFTYQGYTGVRNAFRNVFFNGFTRLNEDITLGLNLSSEISESYSTLTQTDFSFTYTLYKTDQSALHASGELGLLSYVLQSTPYSPGLSRWRVNGDYGLMLEHRSAVYGVCLRNALAPNVDLFNDGFKVKPSINLFASKKWELDPSQKIKASGMVDTEVSGFFNFQGLVEYGYSNGRIAMGYNRMTGFLAGVGLERIEMNSAQFDLLFMYNKTIGLERLRLSNQFELAIRIYKK